MISVSEFSQLTGVQFAKEDEVVIFAATAGEVFRCAAADWNQLLREPSAPPPSLRNALVNIGIA